MWTKVRFDGKVVEETAQSEFTTGKAPDFIPENNIAFSYPAPDQLNFYPEEYSHGYIQLVDGQPYLFNPGAEWLQKVRLMEASSGSSVDVDVAYEQSSRRITFTMPTSLRNGQRYKFQIVNIPKSVMRVDDNVVRVDREMGNSESAGSLILATQSLEGSRNQLEEKSILTYSFRTSLYKTFVEKMRSIRLSPVIRLTTGINIFQLSSFLQGDEAFDLAETGLPGAPAAVQLQAILDQNRWYENYAHPLVYEGYPLLGWMRVRRPEAEKPGIPPVRAIHFDNVITRNTAGDEARPFTTERLVYDLGPFVAADFYDMQRHAVNYAADHPSELTPRLRSLVMDPLPYIRYGRYRIRFSYHLPGINRTTSSYDMEIFNRIPDND
jgi:hypothetical protein